MYANLAYCQWHGIMFAATTGSGIHDFILQHAFTQIKVIILTTAHVYVIVYPAIYFWFLIYFYHLIVMIILET